MITFIIAICWGRVLNSESFSTFQDPSDNYRFFEFLDVWNWLMIRLKYGTHPTVVVSILSQVTSPHWTPPTNSSSCVHSSMYVHKSWLISSAHLSMTEIAEWLTHNFACLLCLPKNLLEAKAHLNPSPLKVQQHWINCNRWIKQYFYCMQEACCMISTLLLF